MSYAAPQPKPKSGTPWTLIVGGVIALLALLLCCAGGFLSFGPVQDLVKQDPYTGSHVIQLEEDEETSIWSENEFATCTVTGPSGTLTDEAPGSSQSVTWGDTSLERIMVIEAEQSGSHTVSCSSPFVIGDGMPAGGIVSAAIGGGLCCISVIVIAVGGVLWLTKRKS